MYGGRLLASTALLLHVTLGLASENTSTATPAPPRAVTLEDHTKIKWPGNPRLSPDGRQVAFTVKDEIHVVAMNGGPSRPITSPGTKASDPQWSRDGRWLYFLSDRKDETSQVFRLPVDTFGEAAQVTEFDRGVDSLQLSPDESRLLLSFAGPAEKKKEEDEKKVRDPWVINRLDFKEDAADGYVTGDRAEHIYVYDLKAKALKAVTSGAYSETEGDWSPDGKSIVFKSNREQEPDASYKSDLWIVDAGNTDAGKQLTRLTNDDWVKSSPRWSPDGKSIAYITAEDGVYGIQHLALVPATGGSPRILTRSLDRWVDSFRYSADGQWVYFIYVQLGGQYLARVRLSDGRIEKLLEGERYVHTFDIARNGAIAALMQNMNDATEVYSVSRGRAARLSSLNDEFLSTVTRATKEKIEYTSTGDTKVEAFVTKPPGFSSEKKYPVVLHLHGGPVWQFNYGYDFANEYLAANGYVVVEPNPRGSTGRGQEFIRGIYQSWGITDYDDVIGAVDHVIKLGYADANRLAVTGYSYGGYMTNVVITRTTRFKAAASGAGHSFIAANYGHDIYQKWYNWELGIPWENWDKYAKLSPLLQAGKVQTPTLFFGGRNDWNVPVLNAELFYQTLKKRGIATELVVYPDTYHSDWKDEYEQDRLRRVKEWFDKHLQ
jgi:dipeptidyl aminopeptidase/acylaminoacyl peptidase